MHNLQDFRITRGLSDYSGEMHTVYANTFCNILWKRRVEDLKGFSLSPWRAKLVFISKLLPN